MAESDSLVRLILLLLAAVVLLPVLAMVFAAPMMGAGHMWGWDGAAGTGPGWPWLLMGLVPIVVFLGVGYLLYAAVARGGRDEEDRALEELRLAYARGDLSSEEFEERRQRLERGE